MRDILGDAGSQENITPGNSSTGITSSVRQPISGVMEGRQAIGALIACEAQTVHFTLDGTAPTAAAGTNVGISLVAGATYEIRGTNNVINFRCIDRVAGSAGTVKVICFF